MVPTEAVKTISFIISQMDYKSYEWISFGKLGFVSDSAGKVKPSMFAKLKTNSKNSVW